MSEGSARGEDSSRRAGRPWLDRPEWAGRQARGAGVRTLFVHWFGAVVWNLLSVPMLVGMLTGRLEGQPLFIEVVLYSFAALGALILFRAIRQTARVLRFRNLTLRLDPFPGSIGGQVGGSVEVPVRPRETIRSRVTLRCIHSNVRDTDDDRRRREDVLWSAQTAPDVERTGSGIRMRFVFDVPEGGSGPAAESGGRGDDRALPESDEGGEGDHHYWSIHLTAELPGADLDESFVVPVYRLDPPLRASEDVEPRPAAADDLEERGIVIDHTVRGLRIDYRRGRYGSGPAGLLLFGALCVGSGAFVFGSVGGGDSGFGPLGSAVGALFLAVFGLIGLLVTGLALHMLLHRLTVEIGDATIRSTKSFGLLTSTDEASVDELVRIEAKATMQTGRGIRARTTYAVHGIRTPGGRILLGDGIRGAYLLDRVRALLEEATGVSAEAPVRGRLHRM